MAQIHFEGQSYTLQENESVLDGLLRHEVRLSHSCKAGVCGSCVMRTTSGSVPARAQAGLKDSWRAQGYFLACVCIPEGDLALVQPGEDLRFGATIVNLHSLS